MYGPKESLVIKINRTQKIPRAQAVTKGATKSKIKGYGRMSNFKAMKVNEGLYSKKKSGVAIVEPKVMEPFDPVPGQVPRRVAIDRKIKEYAQYDIEELLLNLGIDYNQQNESASWLPLELFDDTNFDDYSNEDWLKKGNQKDGSFAVIAGKGLYEDIDEERFRWRDLYIKGYEPEDELFIAYW